MEKWQKEEAVVRDFAQSSGRLILDSIVAVGEDPPDVEASTPTGDRIGIEVTDYFTDDRGDGAGSQVMRAQSQRTEIEKLAQQKFEERLPGVALMVTPFWSPSSVMKVKKTEVAGCIAALVERFVDSHEPPAQVSLEDVPLEWIQECGLGAVIDGIRIGWGEGVKEPAWCSGSGGFLHGDSVRLQDIIDRKGKRLSTYACSYDQAWLLIHFGAEGYGRITRKVTAATYSLAGFSRVFFYDSTSKYFHVIPPDAAARGSAGRA